MKIFMLIFYTYVLLDPRNCQPFYVGKGKNQRMYDHWKHRRSKYLKNVKLKQILCDLDLLNLKPIYVKVIENVTNEEALEKEIELVLLYGRLDLGTGSLCNLTNGGDSSPGAWSLEARQRKREHELAKKKGKPVCQYTLAGDLINTFSSAKVASEQIPGANRSYIAQCCKKKRKTAGGFMWSYLNDSIPVHHRKAVQQYSLDGTLIYTHINTSEAAKVIGTTSRAICASMSGRSKTCYGFVWRYVT